MKAAHPGLNFAFSAASFAAQAGGETGIIFDNQDVGVWTSSHIWILSDNREDKSNRLV
jgi:hypothetical protein